MVYSLGRFGQEEKLKPPLPPINSMEDKVGLAGLSSEMLPNRVSLRTFTAKKKRTPNLKEDHQYGNEVVTNAVPKIVAFHVDSSYQYPSLAGCSCC